MTDLVAAVSAYARRFHMSVGDEHHVASPLGAWLVLALAAPAASGSERARLEEVLGCSVGDAADLAGELLRTPHPALRLAAAAWRHPDFVTPALTAWLDRVSEAARVGDLPTQEQADAWAAEMTGGLIERFPVRIEPRTLLVLATAIAATISWRTPFSLVGSDQLQLLPAPGFDGVHQLLRDPGSAVRQAIVDSPVGALAVHAVADAENDLVIVSVIAAPDAAAGDVVAAAHPIATGVALGSSTLPVISLFDLPLGAGHAWTIAERPIHTMARGGREERYDSILPAWSAESSHDLLAMPDLGFAAAGSALAQLLPPDPRGHDIEAKQVALARYTRTGFEAAAVTAMGVMAGAAISSREGLQRTARLEFGRPYAVVAVARGQHSPWSGLPVFSAWVATPDEAC